MKDFLKDKPKENFQKPPLMPEDMKELKKQRDREVSEENTDLLAARRAAAKRSEEDETTPVTITDPKLEQVTLPPAPKSADDRPATSTSTEPKKPETAAPRIDALPPPSTTTRPREVEPQKKKGKKGTDEP
jgi:hypothetical protein